MVLTAGDMDMAQAERAAERANQLTGVPTVQPSRIDVRDQAGLAHWMEPLDAVCAAVPYPFDLGVTLSALEAGTNVCDLGGNVPVALQQIGLHEEAKQRAIRIVPECGEAPGMANNLVAYAMSLLDEPEDVVLLDRGCPTTPGHRGITSSHSTSTA